MKRIYAATPRAIGRKRSHRTSGERAEADEMTQTFITKPVVGGKPAKERRERDRAAFSGRE